MGGAPGRPECCGERGAAFAPCYQRAPGEKRYPPHPLFTRAAAWFYAVRQKVNDGNIYPVGNPPKP